MKVFDRPFFKKGRGSRAEPLSRPQARNTCYGVFWFFFAPTCTKKNGENFFNVKNEGKAPQAGFPFLLQAITDSVLTD